MTGRSGTRSKVCRRRQTHILRFLRRLRSLRGENHPKERRLARLPPVGEPSRRVYEWVNARARPSGIPHGISGADAKTNVPNLLGHEKKVVVREIRKKSARRVGDSHRREEEMSYTSLSFGEIMRIWNSA